MSSAEIAAVSTRPPSKYWLRYISCQSAPARNGSRPRRNSAKCSSAPITAFSRPESPLSPQP